MVNAAVVDLIHLLLADILALPGREMAVTACIRTHGYESLALLIDEVPSKVPVRDADESSEGKFFYGQPSTASGHAQSGGECP